MPPSEARDMQLLTLMEQKPRHHGKLRAAKVGWYFTHPPASPPQNMGMLLPEADMALPTLSTIKTSQDVHLSKSDISDREMHARPPCVSSPASSTRTSHIHMDMSHITHDTPLAQIPGAYSNAGKLMSGVEKSQHLSPVDRACGRARAQHAHMSCFVTL
jgi:hypothetical protein